PNDMFVVHIGSDANNAVRRPHARFFAIASPKKFEHGIGPIDVPINRVFAGKHALCESLADDHDRVSTLVIILLVEIAPGKNGNSQRIEKAGRDGAQLRARIVFAVDVTITGELQTGTEGVGVTPGSNDSESRLGDSGQRIDATYRFLVKIDD